MTNSLGHRLRLLGHAWRAIGPATLLRNALRWSLDGAARNSNCAFDARFGTDTTATLTPGEAAIPAPRRGDATMYVPSVEQDLDAMLDALAWPDPRVRDAAFVDVGSGKARVVLLAAMRGFRAVHGVELSPVLDAIARVNLERVRGAGALVSPVELALGDATDLAVPAGPVILYLYHPFGAAIAARVIDRVVASLAAMPRPAAILYGHPTLQPALPDDVFTRGGMFAEHARGARHTRSFRIGWSVWTNDAWLAPCAAAL
jgi:SAM-dependent methyltransferase